MQDTATGQSFEPAAPAISLGDLSVGSAEQTGDAAKAAAAEAMHAATQRAVEIPVTSTPGTVDVTAGGLVAAANQAARVPNIGEVATDALPVPPASPPSLRDQVTSFSTPSAEVPPIAAPLIPQPAEAPNPYTTGEVQTAQPEKLSEADELAGYRENAASGLYKLIDIKQSGVELNEDQQRMWDIFIATLEGWK